MSYYPPPPPPPYAPAPPFPPAGGPVMIPQSAVGPSGAYAQQVAGGGFPYLNRVELVGQVFGNDQSTGIRWINGQNGRDGHIEVKFKVRKSWNAQWGARCQTDPPEARGLRSAWPTPREPDSARHDAQGDGRVDDLKFPVHPGEEPGPVGHRRTGSTARRAERAGSLRTARDPPRGG